MIESIENLEDMKVAAAAAAVVHFSDVRGAHWK